jgi:hypothetical protein
LSVVTVMSHCYDMEGRLLLVVLQNMHDLAGHMSVSHRREHYRLVKIAIERWPPQCLQANMLPLCDVRGAGPVLLRPFRRPLLTRSVFVLAPQTIKTDIQSKDDGICTLGMGALLVLSRKFPGHGGDVFKALGRNRWVCVGVISAPHAPSWAPQSSAPVYTHALRGHLCAAKWCCWPRTPSCGGSCRHAASAAASTSAPRGLSPPSPASSPVSRPSMPCTLCSKLPAHARDVCVCPHRPGTDGPDQGWQKAGGPQASPQGVPACPAQGRGAQQARGHGGCRCQRRREGRRRAREPDPRQGLPRLPLRGPAVEPAQAGVPAVEAQEGRPRARHGGAHSTALWGSRMHACGCP